MNNSHLVALFRTFDKKNFRELQKWLQSPFHNQREDVLLLFDYLTAGTCLQNEKSLEKERAFRKIFRGEAFDDAKMRQTMHFLLKATEEFLSYSELKGDDVRAGLALASVYRKRKLDKAFSKVLKNVEDSQKDYEYRNEHFLRNEYLVQQEKYVFFEGKQRTVEMNLQEVSDALDMTYFADKLRQSCLMLAHQKVYKATYEIGLLGEVLEYVKSRDLLRVPAVAVYYYVYRAFTSTEREENFQHLKKVMFENTHLFPKSEIRDIYLMAINYCIGRMNAGDEQYIRESFDLYREGIEKGVLIENNNVTHFTFINVVLNGLKLGEFDWVEHFIHHYKKLLRKEVRDNIVHYSLARLHFERKDYKEAMHYLTQAEYNDILMNLNAKAMLVQIYVEEGELDALESLLESMRTYLQRKDIMGYHKANFSNFISLTKKLVRVNPYAAAPKDKLRAEIQAAAPMTSREREWLLRQLDKL